MRLIIKVCEIEEVGTRREDPREYWGGGAGKAGGCVARACQRVSPKFVWSVEQHFLVH